MFGPTNILVNELVFDSRNVVENDVFIAQKGVNVDGHLYVDKAIALGAKVVVCEKFSFDKKRGNLCKSRRCEWSFSNNGG